MTPPRGTHTAGPMRVQRKRTKGWKKPNDAVYVGRGTQWGNPFRINSTRTRQQCVDAYRYEIERMNGGIVGFNASWVQQKLKGKHLMCWCRLDQSCHADVLLELANGAAIQKAEGTE